MARAARIAPRRALRRWNLSLRSFPLVRAAEVAAPTAWCAGGHCPCARARSSACRRSHGCRDTRRPMRRDGGRCGELHIDTDLGDQDGGDHPIDPRNLPSAGRAGRGTIRALLRCGRRGRRYPARPLRDGAVVSQAGNDGAPIIPPFERQNQIVPLTAQLPSGKVRHRLRPRRCPRSEPSTWRSRKLPKTSLATLASLM